MSKQEFLDAVLPAGDMLLNLARRVVRDEHAAEDLVQETYLNAFRAWMTKRRPERVEPWLATICLNLARSRFRRLKRRPEESFDPQTGVGLAGRSDTESEALARVEGETVRRALWRLPEEQRVAIALVDLCGLSTADAARAMGTPRGTVLSRVHRGRKALAALVRQEVGFHEA